MLTGTVEIEVEVLSPWMYPDIRCRSVWDAVMTRRTRDIGSEIVPREIDPVLSIHLLARSYAVNN